ncbi:chromate efflux transporter [Pelagovum pacificum]|uniref:Chromate efflux transporter n=1 Tax=Pelagovum pacificum TaxID=2588711 RepID=A0A5C5GD02_9RHOB|nr:chromate efflux transporter [Pelagovum pacificum]QQA41333.1 chromate efflux transporter [Pelagovum pacificum]TNY31861.1 chromate efflux transporter [Pelagovum pacificum]
MTTDRPAPGPPALFRIFGRIGVLSFGGPAAQIALMHRTLVDEQRWLTEAQFLRALSFCMLLPGPEAMQLATYAGWRVRGISGGLVAGGLFVLPGALVIIGLAYAYAALGDVPLVQAAFLGIKATVIVIVLQAILKLSARALKGAEPVALAMLAFLALFLFDAPFPLVIGLAALWGALRAGTADESPPPARLDGARTLRIAGAGVALWAAPIAVAWAAGSELLLALGLFFSKLAVVTFGGAYAVLAYMSQEVVTGRGWLSAEQMLDALGLAETTPGPLILVTQFVGQLTGQDAGGPVLALAASLMTLWVTFVPCFIWIFAGAPLIDWLESQPRIAAALRAITAAVVGVIANLSVWFAAHVLFGEVGRVESGLLSVVAPSPGSFSPLALGLTVVAGILLLALRWPLLAVLGLMAGTGVVAGLL